MCVWEMEAFLFALSEMCFSQMFLTWRRNQGRIKSCLDSWRNLRRAAASSVFTVLADKSAGLEFQPRPQAQEGMGTSCTGFVEPKRADPPQVPSQTYPVMVTGSNCQVQVLGLWSTEL